MLALKTKKKYYFCDSCEEWLDDFEMISKDVYVHEYEPINDPYDDNEWIFEEDCHGRTVYYCGNCNNALESDRSYHLWVCKRCGSMNSEKEEADECCT